MRALIPERRGILAVDDTGSPKQGTQSVGVKRQYSGALGKTGNCQVGASTALIGPTLVWPTSCELYLLQEWAADAARRLLQAWAPGATASRSLEAMGHAVPEAAWQVVTWGHGTKGPLTARFVARRVRFRHGRGERWVLFERCKR